MTESIDYSKFILMAADQYKAKGMYNRYGILKDAAEEYKFMSVQIDKMNQVMECGHLGRYQMRDEKTDTQYCCFCALERMSLFIAYNMFGEDSNSFYELSAETQKRIIEITENE